MIFKGNPYNNYMSADASGDKKLKRDILLSAIAEIIVNKPDLVRKHLMAHKFNPGGTGLRSLSDAVSYALHKSPMFATKMAHEILGGNYGAEGATMTGGTEPVTMPAPTPVSDPAAVTGTSDPAPATNTPNVAPVVSGIGEVFAPTSTSGNMPATNVSPTPTPAQVDSQAAPKVYVVDSNTGGGGFGGGGFGGGGGASSELAAKVDALGTDVTVNIKKVIGITLLVAAAISTYYYFNKKGK